MARRKRHSLAEISEKLAKADDLASQGKLQSEIANTLGVSVMTLHRWRKPPTPHPPVSITMNETEEFEQELGLGQRLSQLQYENSRLRQLVIDLLFEKMKLEEAAAASIPAGVRRPGPQRGARSGYR
jgi:putative transposase